MDGSSTNGSAFGSISTNNDDSDQNALDMNDSGDIGHLSLEEGAGASQGMEREDGESDGQRRMLSMDDDGGSFFEASAMHNLETVVRKGGNNVADVNNMHNQVVTDYQEFLNNESDGVLFDPAKRLNFDDTTEDEEDETGDGEGDCFNNLMEQNNEMVVAGIRDESMGKEEERGEDDNSGSEDGSSGSNYLDHRPRVNGSDLVEDGAVAAAVTSTSRMSLNLVPEQGQNVRIIEGHDSSLQDDDDGNTTSLSGVGGNAFRFNGNFMQTQVVNLPSLPSGRSRNESDDDDDDDENEDGQNLYDSLDPEDGTSPYGGHTMVEHQVLDPNTSEYYSAGSLMSLQTLTSQQSHVDGDGESFWPQQEMGELSHLRSSVASNPANSHSFQQESFSSSHHDPPAPVPNAGNFNFQSSASGISDQISVKDSAVGSCGDCGDFGSSLISSESTTHQNMMSDSQDGFELCDEGLLHGTQLYAQPMTSPKANQSFDRESDNSTMSLQHKVVHQANSKKHIEGGGRMLSASAPNSNKSNHIHITESRANRDAESSVQSNDHNSISGSNNSSVGVIRDERQAAAGSSGTPWNNQNQSAKPKVTRSTSVPRKRITATTKAQQTRRPAVQGSASREGNSKVATSSNTSAAIPVASNNALTGNQAIAASSSGTNKSGKIPSHTMHSSAAMTNSTRATAQGGDSAMMATSFMKNGGKNKSNDDNKFVTSDGGCRVSGSGAVNIDMMNPSSKFSRSYQPHSSSRPSSSYASMSSLTTATNNRVSGVGKESHYNQRRGPAQSSSGPVHSQSRTDQSNQVVEMGNSSSTGSYSNTKQQGKAVRTQSALSNHSLSGQENVKPMASNFNNMQITSSHVPQVSSDQDLQLSVNSDSRSSSHSSSLHDILMSTSQTLQQQQQHKSQQQQQQRQQHHSQHHYRQEFPIQQQQNQVPAQPSTLNPFLLSPQSPLSPSGSDHSHHSYNREAVITQMDTLHHRQPTRHNAELLTSIDQSEGAIPGMEEVRSHLNSMLNMAADRSISGHDQTETATELLSFDQPVQRQLQFDLDSSSAFNGTSGPEDMSEILENFPTFSSKMFTEMSGMAMHSSSNKSDTQAHGENHYLRDNLEKERYRRKHCEQQIQKLNAKLLETQQQLAVAVSTDKRKDLMIEQLDKQLARVVEGWKKREADKDVLVSSLTGEKEHAEECLHRQQTMINNFEHDLAQTVAELKEEKEKSSETIEKLKSELMESRQMREEVEENLASAADKCSKMAEEWDTLTKAKVTAEKLAQQTQDTLVEEGNKWTLKESDLLSKITQVKEANEKVINMEKVKLEEEKKKREDLESECGELKTELKKIVLDAEQLVREKESQKVEMSIMEAKFESAQRKLEADLHAQMEKEIAEQAAEYHSKLETSMEEMSEKHRKQVVELHTRHQQDMEQQMARANEEIDRKDSENKRKIDEMEEKLAENRNEISNLKQSKLKLESQRMEILSKLQFMMQSQWNEAVSLLVSTPQKRGLSSSFLSNQSMSMSGMLSNAQPNGQPLGDNNNMTNGCGIGNGSNDSSLTSSLNLASLVMSASAPPPPSSSALPPTTVTPSQQSASITSTTVTTASTVVMSFSPPGGEKREDCGEGNNGDKAVMESKKPAPLLDGYKGSSDHSSSSTSSSSNNNSMHLGGLVSNEPDATIKGIHSVKEADKGGREGGEQMATRDKVEEYVFRTAVQGTNKPMVSSQHRDMPPYSASPKSPITCTATSDPGRDNSIVSAVVHHPSIPTSGFRAMAIQSPRQRSSSRFWNDLGVDPTSLEQGSHAPPPSAVTSHSSMHHDDHIHGTALVHNNQMLQQQRKQQQQQQHHQQQQQHQQQYQQELHRHHHHSSPQLHHSQPNPHPHPNQQQHNHRQQQQQHHQQRQQQQQRQQNEVQTSGQAWPPSFLSGNPSNRDLHKHTTKAGDMSPPVRQPAMRREDLEDSIVSEGSGVTDPIRLQADYNHLTDQVDAHENRQEELQHYIQMLLKKAPGTVEWERGNESFDILESSRDLTEWGNRSKVDLDLTETGQALEMTNQMGRLQELRERQQGKASRHGYDLSGQSHMAPPGMAPSNNGMNASFLSEMGLGGGGGGSGQVLSPQNLVEISQLLSMYREQWETSPESATNSNTAGQLMDVLALRRSHGVDANLTSIPDKVFAAANTSSVSTGSGGKNSSRGHHNKKSKACSSSLSSSTSSGTTKDAFIRNRKKIGYQSADSNLNSSSDSGHHHHGGGGPKPGTSSTGRKGQGAGKGAPPSSKPVKASGHSAWK